ncbi:Putative aminoacrylate hydrolase RutD [Streptomyces purpurascens]
MTSYKSAPTRTVAAGGVTFAYRELGPRTGVPVVFLTHLAGQFFDNWDPRVVDGIAAKRHVITFDNRGVGASSGSTPRTVQAMAKDAVTFIRALGLERVDLHGFSMGGMIAQVIAQTDPDLVRKLILTGTGPAGGEGIKDVTRLSHLDTVRGLLTLQDPKQFLFFTRTPQGRRAGKDFLGRLKERTQDPGQGDSRLVRSPAQGDSPLGAGAAPGSLRHSPARARRERRERQDGSESELGRPGAARAERRVGALPRRRPRRHLPVPPAVRGDGSRVPRAVGGVRRGRHLGRDRRGGRLRGAAVRQLPSPHEREGVLDSLLKDLIGELPVGQGAGQLQRPHHHGEEPDGLGPGGPWVLRRQAGGDLLRRRPALRRCKPAWSPLRSGRSRRAGRRTGVRGRGGPDVRGTDTRE